MTAVLAQKGQVVIPARVRDELELSPGDDLEVNVVDGEIVLTPLRRRRNAGLMNLLLHPPGRLEIPAREHAVPPPLDFSE